MMKKKKNIHRSKQIEVTLPSTNSHHFFSSHDEVTDAEMKRQKVHEQYIHEKEFIEKHGAHTRAVNLHRDLHRVEVSVKEKEKQIVTEDIDASYPKIEKMLAMMRARKQISSDFKECKLETSSTATIPTAVGIDVRGSLNIEDVSALSISILSTNDDDDVYESEMTIDSKHEDDIDAKSEVPRVSSTYVPLAIPSPSKTCSKQKGAELPLPFLTQFAMNQNIAGTKLPLKSNEASTIMTFSSASASIISQTSDNHLAKLAHSMTFGANSQDTINAMYTSRYNLNIRTNDLERRKKEKLEKERIQKHELIEKFRKAVIKKILIKHKEIGLLRAIELLKNYIERPIHLRFISRKKQKRCVQRLGKVCLSNLNRNYNLKRIAFASLLNEAYSEYSDSDDGDNGNDDNDGNDGDVNDEEAVFGNKNASHAVDSEHHQSQREEDIEEFNGSNSVISMSTHAIIEEEEDISDVVPQVALDLNNVEWTYGTDENGQPYYYNVRTRQSQWEPPIFITSSVLEATEDNETAFVERQWMRSTDMNGNEFYTDILTGESTWHLPQTHVELDQV
jgi:hypothetical protein